MPQLLFLGPEDSLDESRRILLKRAGYSISPIHSVKEAIDRRAWEGCALVILARTMPASERKQIVGVLRESTKIVVLDLASSSGFKRDRGGLREYGPESFLELVGRSVMASHGHPEIQGESVAWVDRDRRYVHVTDGFLRMIGYDREEVLGRLIDDFTYPGTADTKEVFHQYLENGKMDGRFVLRHKSGAKVAIEYEAGVLPDGCMYSNMRPLQERRHPRPSRRGDQESVAQ